MRAGQTIRLASVSRMKGSRKAATGAAVNLPPAARGSSRMSAGKHATGAAVTLPLG